MKKKRGKLKRRILWSIAILLAGAIFLIILADDRVSSRSSKTYTSIQEIPHRKVGLLLGTAKYAIGGRENLYYRYRLEATRDLFFGGKIDYILVSGDNGTVQYNEPSTFRKDLIKMGIPSDRIVLDYAGFRTLDSVERCKRVFGEDSITVISQGFHNQRAIYIADNRGIHAIGFNAKDVGTSYGFKTRLREKLARVKTLLDLHILNTEPKFLGEEIQIGGQDSTSNEKKDAKE
ncbi:MAG: YdcF family protein [Bacteroidota bacterium]|nr:YdcF family protein [Bacteroidota bacterium]MDX5427466.1 YdcF family protein [Bacteroidota bacterium]